MNVKYDGPPQERATTALEVEAVAKVYYEDSLQSAVAEVSTKETGPFVRILEWNDTKPHMLIPNLDGKKVRVTVEVIE